MAQSKSSIDADSSSVIEDGERISPEIYLGEIFKREREDKYIKEAERNEDVEEDSEEFESNETEETENKTISSNEESSKANRGFVRCLQFCRMHFGDPELVVKLIVPLVSIVVSIVVVLILFVFEDKIHQNLNSLVNIEQKLQSEKRYSLL